MEHLISLNLFILIFRFLALLFMKYFLLKTIVILSFIFLTLVFIYFIPGNKDYYYGASIDKHRLLEITSSPRIIFIGGSNLAFGLDSKLIEQEFSVPVINMSLHAGLGLNYMLNEVKPYIRDKDILIIVPEYETYYNGELDGNGEILMGLLDANPLLIQYFSVRQILRLLSYIPQLFRAKLQSSKCRFCNITTSKERIYRRDAFNNYGDMIIHLENWYELNDEKLLELKKILSRKKINSIKILKEQKLHEDELLDRLRSLGMTEK